MWNYRGQARPPFAHEPAEGQESVWDYPRPPALVPDERWVRIEAAGEPLAETRRARRVLETASPPTVYIDPADVATERLVPVPGSSHCEWKGAARYWALEGDPSARPVAWSYDAPQGRFAELAGHFAFYPSRVEATIDGERVRAQAGDFYGGWITDEVIGPYKGDPGTGHW